MIDKVPIEPSEHSEVARDLIDVLDRILDKGIVVDPLSRLNMMDRRQVDRLDAQGRSGSLALAPKRRRKPQLGSGIPRREASMRKHKNANVTSAQDIAAFTKDSSQPVLSRPALTDSERNDVLLPKPLVKILNYKTREVVQASLAQLKQQMRDFRKVILLIEDEGVASNACAAALHDLGYDGVQLITHLLEAEQHLDDIVSNLVAAPAAIVLDLGLGSDSGFAVLRKCHAEPKLQQVPILVWTKHSDDLAATFSRFLGARDFLVKSRDEQELREALKRLLKAKRHTTWTARQ